MSSQSIQAYIDILPHIKPTEKKILDHLAIWGSRDSKKVSADLKLSIRTAAARLSELHDSGIVYQTPEGEYAISDPSYVDTVKMQRAEARYLRWKKVGEKNSWHFRYATFDKHGRAPEPKDYE